MRAAVRRAAVPVATFATAIALSGCAAPRVEYDWGHYESLIYAAYARPGSLTPDAEAAQLEKDLAASKAGKARIPPGWHAHLGTVYFQAGKPDLARRELLAEKAAYPESATLVDTLIANLERATGASK